MRKSWTRSFGGVGPHKLAHTEGVSNRCTLFMKTFDFREFRGSLHY